MFCSGDRTKNAGNLSNYFRQNSELFTTFHFSPGYSTDRPYIAQYRNGKEVLRLRTFFYLPNSIILRNLIDLLFFWVMITILVPRNSFLITNAPIYCVFELFFRLVKSIKYVLWIGDYYPDSSISMKLYNIYVRYLNATIAYVLYLSPPLYKIYSRSRDVKKFKKLVTLGIERKGINTRRMHKKIVLGFIGIIRKQQGLDLVFDYISRAKNVRLEIVGDGYYLSYYKKLSKKMGINNKVKFYGKLENVSPVCKKWDIGVALYTNSRSNLSRYCEPTKIKDYVSYELPVITTKTTYLYKEIAIFKAGEVIEENISSLSNAVEKISSNYGVYIDGVRKMINKYEYKKWYDDKLNFLAV